MFPIFLSMSDIQNIVYLFPLFVHVSSNNILWHLPLGLQNMHLLTYGAKYMLRVDLENFEGGKASALYGTFFIESESDGYRLHVIDFKNVGAGKSDLISPLCFCFEGALCRI